jgi:hypothetical protein
MATTIMISTSVNPVRLGALLIFILLSLSFFKRRELAADGFMIITRMVHTLSVVSASFHLTFENLIGFAPHSRFFKFATQRKHSGLRGGASVPPKME